MGGDEQTQDQANWIARKEVDNGLRQFDLALSVIQTYLEPDRPFFLTPSLVSQLQAAAVNGIDRNPGKWRSGAVRITGSHHTPPEPYLVPGLVQEMCDYVNDNLHEKTPLHLAAYIMWRLNWIHPFADGNGRTSRVLSYIVLCITLRHELPGGRTIPQQIQENRDGYFKALEAADTAMVTAGEIDVSGMENELKQMLANQLLSVIEMADGDFAQ